MQTGRNTKAQYRSDYKKENIEIKKDNTHITPPLNTSVFDLKKSKNIGNRLILATLCVRKLHPITARLQPSKRLDNMLLANYSSEP